MANKLITMKTIAGEALATLYNNLVFGGVVFRDYDPAFSGKQGDTVTVRRPAVFQALDFDRSAGITVQDAVESSFDVRLNRIIDVSFAVTAEDLTLTVDDFNARLLTPAMNAIVQRIDGDLAAAALAAAVGGGDPKGSLTAATTDIITLAGHGFLNGDPVIFPTLTSGAGLTAATTKYYVRDRTDDTFKVSATIGGAAVDITTAYTAGTVADAPGGTVTIDSTSPTNTALINAGTVLSKAKAPLADRVALLSPEGAGKMRKDSLFIDADRRGNTDGLIDASIGRKLGFDTYESQALSGVTQNVAMHKDSLALVMRTLALPKGKTADTAATASFQGMGMRVVYDYDINKKQDVVSIDALLGIKSIRPAWSAKMDLS